MNTDRSFDKSNLFDVLAGFPDQFAKGLEAAEDVTVKGKFKDVIVCGMGGSAFPADVLKTYLPVTEVPVYISRGYSLPFRADYDSLVICITYSGNTEETLSAFREALQLDCNIIGITAGGELEELCRQNKIPVIMLPKERPGFQPRHALGYTFAALLKVLSNCGVVRPRDEELLDAAKTLKEFNFHDNAAQIAKRLYKRIPVIYSSDRNRKLARIWKTRFNETSKVMAFYNYFPELNHNEMTGHTAVRFQAAFHTIILRDRADDPRIQKRMAHMAEMIKARGGEVTFIDMMGSQNGLVNILSVLLFSDWVAYYLAREYKLDPMPMEFVEEFKQRLEQPDK